MMTPDSSAKKTRKKRGQRKDGMIQVALDIGKDASGKRIRKYFYGHTRAEAERKRDEYKKRGTVEQPSLLTVRDWVEIYKSTYRTRVNPAYLASDDAPYNRMVSAIGNRRISDIRESDLQKLMNDVSGMSFSSVEKYRQAIKRVFKKARKNKLIWDDPSEDIQLPNFSRGTHRALEQWETAAILRWWNHPDARAGLWVMLMLFAGLRRGEMMALDWDAVDLEARKLTVRQTAVITGNRTKIEQRAKTEAGLRIIPICDPLFDALSSVPEANRSGYVCLSAHGKQLSESAVSRGLEAFCTVLTRLLNNQPAKQSGHRTDLETPDPNAVSFAFRAHDLRHTFCTFLYEAGIDVKSAAYFMGHADVRVTMEIYTHLSDQKRQSSGEQYQAFINSFSAPKLP